MGAMLQVLYRNLFFIFFWTLRLQIPSCLAVGTANEMGEKDTCIHQNLVHQGCYIHLLTLPLQAGSRGLRGLG